MNCAGMRNGRDRCAVAISKPSGGSRRLCIPAVRDRVLQTAVAMQLAPRLESAELEPVSFAYRPGRSVQMALGEVLRHRDAGFEWLLDADIDGFFDHIDHALLIAKLARHVADRRVLGLVLSWLKADVADADGAWCMIKGIPQGSPVSPLLANLYLDELDEAIQDDFPMVRYADDFVVMARGRDEAEAAEGRVRAVLDRLKLGLNRDKTRIVHFDEGFTFLGARFLGVAMWLERAQESIPPAAEPPPGGASESWSPSSPPIDRALTDALIDAQTVRRSGAITVTPPGSAIAAVAQAGPGPSAGHEPRLRTLHITEPGCYLSHNADRVLVRKDDVVLQDIPAAYIDLIVIGAHGVLSTPFLGFCCERGIDVALTDRQGKWMGLLAREPLDRIDTQRAQFMRQADAGFVLELAREIVLGKLANSRTVLRRYQRRRDMPELALAISRLGHAVARARTAKTLDALRGAEGAGAAAYFAGVRGMLATSGWTFGPRARPAADPFNAALNYGYSILAANVASFLRQAGLNPFLGFLHAAGRNHPAAASDLMEEFRAVAVDAVLLNLFLRRRFAANDFVATADGVSIELAARRAIIHAIEGRMNAPLEGRDGEADDVRRQIERQARTLARVLRGEQSTYRPFAIR